MMQNVCTFCVYLFYKAKNFSKCSSKCIQSHINALYLDLDSIKDVASFEETIVDENSENANYRIINKHYLFCFLISLLPVIDDIILLCKRKSPDDYTKFFSHKIYQRKFWKQGDGIYTGIVLNNLAIFYLMTFQSQMDPKYQLFAWFNKQEKCTQIICNNTVWNAGQSAKLLQFRIKARKLSTFIMISVLCCNYPYWMWGLYSNWTSNSIRDVLFLLYLPFFCMNASFACIYVSIYFLLAVNYARIQQEFLLCKVARLSQNIIIQTALILGPSEEKIWAQFCTINQEILEFFKKLKAYNRHWGPTASLYFVFHTGYIVNLAHGLLVDHSEFDPSKRSFFFFFTVELIAIMTYITNECSKIVRNNERIYRTNVRFCFFFQRYYNPKTVHLIKMSQIIANYKGTRNGFVLVNNYTIDSRAQEILTYYVTRLLLKTFKREFVDY